MAETETEQNSPAPMRPESGPAVSGPRIREIIPLQQAAFFTDSNRLMKELQNRTWAELAFLLFDTCRERYLAACALVGVEPELAELVRGIKSFEQPRLARTYRKIAAFYRFAFIGEQQEELPFDSRNRRVRPQAEWEKFFRLESNRLARIDHLVRSILRAVAYGSSAEGRAAEARVIDVLDERYGRFHLARRLELLKLSIHPEELESWRFLDGPDREEYPLDPRVRPDPPA